MKSVSKSSKTKDCRTPAGPSGCGCTTAWFRDDSGAVLGVILFNPESNYWGYVMCAVVGGEFKRLGLGADFTMLALARKDLAASMERHIAREA